MYLFQVTTQSPQFVGQAPEQDIGGKNFFRHTYMEYSAAKAATEHQPRAKIWSHQKGNTTGGELLFSRGYV